MDTPPTSPPPANLAARPGGLIFVVDDNALLADFNTTLLQGEGYCVQCFVDPKLVLAALKEANPKPFLLVTDYDMGEMNGLELIVAAHKIHPALRTILLSGTINDSSISRHPAKVEHFLGKPYEAGQLKALVAELRER